MSFADLTNDKGESFKTKLLQAGAFDINKYTTEQDIAARDLFEAQRDDAIRNGTYQPDEFEIGCSRRLKTLNEKTMVMWQRFKRTALNEEELAAAKAARSRSPV